MSPFKVSRLSWADAVSMLTALLGFLAILIVPMNASLAARLLLVAVVTDGLDGIVARTLGGSDIGPLLDSLADLVAFGVAPALFVAVLGVEKGTPRMTAVLGVAGGVFLVFSILRTAFYTDLEWDEDRPGESTRPGVPNTLAAAVIGLGYLAGLQAPLLLGMLTLGLSVAMVLPMGYPPLNHLHAIILGGLQILAIAFPSVYGRVFPRVMVTIALVFVVFGPIFYSREQVVDFGRLRR